MGEEVKKNIEEKSKQEAESNRKVLYVRVGIRDEYYKLLPLGNLQARVGVATVLSYYGTNERVYYLLQRTTHKTRAYIINAVGLKGFLVPPPSVSEILYSVKKSESDKKHEWEEFQNSTMYQHIDLNLLVG